MKKYYLLLLFFLLTVPNLLAQTLEDFESASVTDGSSTFTSNGQSFTITGIGNTFVTQTTYPGTGWNGTAADNKYIDNSNSTTPLGGKQFSIKTTNAASFTLKSLWLYLTKANSTDFNIAGSSCSIQGKLSNVVQFTATASSGFATGFGSTNGYSEINMVSYGGSNNSNTIIDEFVVTTTGTIDYIAMDAMRWQIITTPTITTSGTLTNFTSCVGVASSPPQSFSVSGVSLTGNITVTPPTGYEVATSAGGTYAGSLVLTQSGGSVSATNVFVRLASSASSNPGGNISITSTGATPKTIAVTSTLTAYPSISVHPANKTSCPGTNHTFSVTAAGAASYQWHRSIDAGNTFNPIALATSSTLSVTGITTAMSGYQYYVTVSNGTCGVNSNIATLTVPNITTSVSAQTDTTCNGGNDGSATVSASGGSIPYTYSWLPSGGSSATATGLTAQTYTVTITDNNGCSKTQSVVIGQPTVAATTPAISVQPASTSVCAGTTATFSVTSTNTNTYQWQVDDGSGFVNISNGGTNPTYSGATTAILTINSVTQVMSSFHYRVVLTSICSNTIASNGAATLTVKPLPIAIATPSSKTICSGTSPGIALTSSPTGATFAWTAVGTGSTAGYSTSSGTSIAQTLTGTGVVTYTVTPTLNGCPGTPITVDITVNPLPVATATPSSQTICSGGASNIALTSSPTGATFAWTAVGTGSTSGFSASSGTSIAQTITGTGVVTYTVTPTLNGCPGTPITVAITVNPLPVVTATPASKTICSGTAPNIALTSSPTGATFAWTAAGTGTTAGYSDSSGTTLAQTLTGSGVVTYTITPTLNGCPGTPITVPITVNGPTTITGQPTAAITCAGGNASFSATDSNATSYQWQVSTGGPFSNITNNAIYGGAQTATLNITGATAAMNGYSYRLVATGSCTSDTSASKVLTVTTVTATKSQTNVSCNGEDDGIATVTLSGGTSPYTYLWSNGATTATISGLIQGTYTVTIKDVNLCENQQSFTITEPAVLTSSISKTDALCNGGTSGTVTLTPSGGTTPYAYLWSNGATTKDLSGLPTGTYSVTITDDNGCTATNSIIVNQPSAFSVTTSQTDILCNGAATGSAGVTVSGATPGYTYSWSPSGGTGATATGLIAGTYTVTIKDANLCQTTRSFTIIQPAALVASAGTTTHVNCRGDATGAATVNVTGGTGAYTYSWAPSGGTAATATGLIAGIYIVTVKDASLCSTTQSFTINQPTAVLSATTSSIGVSCFGGSNGIAGVTASGGTAPYTYLWAPSGGIAATENGLATGNYTCTITDAKGCTLVKNITISTPAAFASTISKTDVSCNGGTNGTATVVVTGATGPYTYSWAPSGGNSSIATGLAAGTYTVTVQDGNTCSHTATITVDQPSALSATTSKTDVLCNGGNSGSATVSVSGGTPGYTYSWSPSGGNAATATGLIAGGYACTITDAHGCTLTENFTINQNAVLTSGTSQTNGTCLTLGQAAVIGVSGGATPYTYSWAPSGGTAATATGLATGNYTCTITDANGCTLTKNFSITSTNTLTATTSQTDPICNGANTGTATVVPAGAPGPYTYVWSPSGGNAATATGLTAGNYSVTITASNGCSIVKNFTITEPSAITATQSQTNILCFGASTGSAGVTVFGGTGAYTYVWSPSGGTGATATGLIAGTYTVTIKDANLCQITKNFTITEQPQLVAIAGTQNNVSCNGGTNGSATVNVTGGTGAYTYVWSPSGGTAATASGFTAGTYTVTVKDANLCQTTQSFTITEPAILSATTTQTDVLCNGGNSGSAGVTVLGGTTPYTYVWSPSGGTNATATGLTAGSYTVTITDAKGCTLVKNFTIAQPVTPLTATTSQTDATCFGGNGSASVTASGGTIGYTYLWAPSGGTAATATGLAAGNYTCTITDANGCTSVKNFTITEPASLAAITSQTDVSCNGGTNGTAGITVSGGTGTYTYVWAPSGGTAAIATGLAAGNYTVTITDANTCTLVKNITIAQPAVLDATTTQTNVLCNGGSTGSATVVPSGGTAPYTYVWSPSGGTNATATGLAIGSYTITITDAKGCTVVKNVTITQPAVLGATTSQTDGLCNGGSGSATVVPTGGTTPYTYAWSPSGGTAATATGLAAGTYTVLITDANSCTVSKSFTIITAPALTATTSQTNILCFGGTTGSASVVVSGGTAPYTYAWSPSGGTAATATGLAAGTYVCTITDANSCTLTKSFTITQLPALVLTGSSSNITCHGSTNGTAGVSATGGTPGYTYLWSPSGGTSSIASGLAAGVYTCTVTDTNGCTATRSFTIYEQPAITVTSVKTNVLCFGATTGSATVIATGGVPGYSYIWAPSGGYNATATNLAAGAYTVTVTDSAGCSVVHNVTISSPEALDVDATQTNITCSGNNDGALSVEVSGGIAPYTYTWTPSSAGTGPSVSGLDVGNYGVTITDANGCTTIRNFSISQPAPLTASITKTDVGCYGGNNGSALATISGGTPPYTYSWVAPGGGTPDPSNLIAGTYTVTITDAHGCTFTGSITINQPLQVTVNSQPQDVTVLAGGNATYTVNAINANGYQWQVSADGSNWVNITNGGSNPSYSGATTSSLTITNVPSGHNGYLYRVLVKYGVNCSIISSDATLNINNVIKAIDDDFSDNSLLTGEGGIAGDVTENDLFNGQPVNDEDIIISIVDNDGLFGVAVDSDGNLIVPISATQGTYTVTYSICEAAKPTNCSTAEAIVVVTDLVGTKTFGDINLSIYPNPATTKVFIKIPDFSSHNNMKVAIHDLNGRLVKTSYITAELESIDVTGLESGVYIFNITSDTGHASKRIVIDKKF